MMDINSFIRKFENPIISLLKRCDESYTNIGEYYVLSDDEKELIKDFPNCSNADEVNDFVYDSIFYKAKELYPDDPYFRTVGAETHGVKVKLPFQMGSCTECHKNELKPWLLDNELYVIEAKLDGCSCELIYENGFLKQAYTRGDGTYGCEIKKHIIRFNNIPFEIPYKEYIAIRGEVIVKKQDFEDMAQELKQEVGKTYKNIRNSVAGLLNSKVCPESFTKYAKFVAYHIENKPELPELEKLTFLNNQGFEVTSYIYKDGKDICEEDMTDFIKQLKLNYDYEIDGIVLKLNTILDEYKGYDTGTLNPSYMRKYKVGAVDSFGISDVVDIVWDISAFGYLKPIIKIKPVDIDGSTIEFITGNNYKHITDNKISIGAKVKVIKAGSVIPFCDSVVEYAQEENYNIPNKHIWYSNGVDIIFKKDVKYDLTLLPEWQMYYREMYLQRLVYFCDKMKIDFAGYGNIARIVANRTDILPYTVRNLIEESKEVFEYVIGVNGIKFYESLHKKLIDMNPSTFFDANICFGRSIGQLKLDKIIDTYGTLNVSYNQLLNVEGFAEKTAEQYSLHLDRYEEWIEYINNNDFISIKYPEKNIVSDRFQNLVVVFTGIRDKEMETYIISNGGRVVSSCTKDVNLVITKDINSSSSKIQKARKQGAEIISYDEAKERYS